MKTNDKSAEQPCLQGEERQYTFSEYVQLFRWISYYNQIKEVVDLASAAYPQQLPSQMKVLVIGKGDGIVPMILGLYDIHVTIFDYDSDLKPDVVGDVKEIGKYFNNDSFSLIMCCQVLEHLEYVHFANILKQFAQIAPNVLLTLPHRRVNILAGRMKIFKIPLLKPQIAMPKFWLKDIKRDERDEHFWEIGIRGYPLKKIRRDIMTAFSIQKQYTDPLNTWHRFFVLKRRQ